MRIRKSSNLLSHRGSNGGSFELGGNNVNKINSADMYSVTEMIRLKPCYFDKSHGCSPSSCSTCPVDGRSCSADRSYFDSEYGRREDESNVELGLIYAFWGGDLRNSTILKNNL
jgi:hypothetical protein